MKTIKARYNWGRWIWDCPVCNAGNKIEPGQHMAICGECYPGKIAKKYSVINGVVMPGYDKKKQDIAKRQAVSSDEVYKIQFPRNYKEIVDFLRSRKEEHQSWEIGQSIEDLEAENAYHKELDYLRSIEPEEKVNVKQSDKRLPDVDEKTLRRIY